MNATETEDVGEIAWRKLNAHADSWWLSLFLPRGVAGRHDFDNPKTVGFDEHQPLLLGETLIATNRAMIAWCPWDDDCPWLISPLKRENARAKNIRHVASLTMQAWNAAQRNEWFPAALIACSSDNSFATCRVGDSEFNNSLCQLLRELPRCEVTLAKTIVQNETQLGLFFRWGRHGGGFLLPLDYAK